MINVFEAMKMKGKVESLLRDRGVQVLAKYNRKTGNFECVTFTEENPGGAISTQNADLAGAMFAGVKREMDNAGL